MVCFEHNKIPRLDLVNWYYYFFCPLQTLYHTPFLGGWWTIPSHPNLFFLSKRESWTKRNEILEFSNPQSYKPQAKQDHCLSISYQDVNIWESFQETVPIFEIEIKNKFIHCVFECFEIFACGVVWKREKEIKYSLLFSSEKNGTK